MTYKTYPAKVLLFGEYTVLLGGQALAIPYLRYRGQWVKSQQADPANSFDKLAGYLAKINIQLHTPLDLQAFNAALEQGATFHSNIPQGVGLGSSAALTAAIYDTYGHHSRFSLQQKKEDLGHIEAFYHGRSSGFDALISLQQLPIVVGAAGQLIQTRIPKQPTKIYILYSQRPRQTQQLVTWFGGACQVAAFREQMMSLAELNKEGISQFKQGNPILEVVKKISEMQYVSLRPLVPPEMQNFWSSTLADGTMALKLLGAGGGGCYLLFSEESLGSKEVGGFLIEEIDAQLFNSPDDFST